MEAAFSYISYILFDLPPYNSYIWTTKPPIFLQKLLLDRLGSLPWSLCRLVSDDSKLWVYTSEVDIQYADYNLIL